jgi:hypothetical protein
VCFDPECVRRALASGGLSRNLKIGDPPPEDLGRRLLEIIEDKQRKR